MGVPEAEPDPNAAPAAGAASAPEGSASAPEAEKDEDPMKALEDAIKKDAGKK